MQAWLGQRARGPQENTVLTEDPRGMAMGTGHTEGSVQQEGTRVHHMRHWRGAPGVAVSSLRLVFLCGCPPGSLAPPGCSLLLLKHVRTAACFLVPFAPTGANSRLPWGDSV